MRAFGMVFRKSTSQPPTGERMKLDGKSSADVHVVTLHLIFEQNFGATTTEGMHFDRKRIVIFDDLGNLLHISGDGATELPVLAI